MTNAGWDQLLRYMPLCTKCIYSLHKSSSKRCEMFTISRTNMELINCILREFTCRYYSSHLSLNCYPRLIWERLERNVNVCTICMAQESGQGCYCQRKMNPKQYSPLKILKLHESCLVSNKSHNFIIILVTIWLLFITLTCTEAIKPKNDIQGIERRGVLSWLLRTSTSRKVVVAYTVTVTHPPSHL